jgi:hypothetical protein
LKFFSEEEIKPLSITIEDDVKQSRTDSTPPNLITLPNIITSERAQQTSPFDMSLVDDDTNINDTITNENNHQRSISQLINSVNSSLKRSSSDEHLSTLPIDDEEESPHEIKSILTTLNKTQPIPKIKYTHKTPSTTSSTPFITKNGKTSSLKWSASLNTCKEILI